MKNCRIYNNEDKGSDRVDRGDDWYLAATKGSHRQYKHPVKPGRVTIAGHPGDDLAPGTLNSILKQSGLKEEK